MNAFFSSSHPERGSRSNAIGKSMVYYYSCAVEHVIEAVLSAQWL